MRLQRRRRCEPDLYLPASRSIRRTRPAACVFYILILVFVGWSVAQGLPPAFGAPVSTPSDSSVNVPVSPPAGPPGSPTAGVPGVTASPAGHGAGPLSTSDDDADQKRENPAKPGPPLPASVDSWAAPVFTGGGKDQPERVFHLVLSQWLTNCYILAGPSGQAIVIDPADWLKDLPGDDWDVTGQDTAKLLQVIKENHLVVRYIVNTHGHLDHVSGNPALKKAFPDCVICMNPADVDANGRPKDSHMFPDGLPKVDRLLREGDSIGCDGIRLRVLFTPGHSPGSISLRCGSWVFTGDTLFYHTVGRTDFHDGSGNWDLELKSILEKLYRLPAATLVLPGHALFTTIGEEKAHNPWTVTPK